jgi:hypothetical protein
LDQPAAVFFLRQPSRPNAPRLVENSINVPGSGVWVTGTVGLSMTVGVVGALLSLRRTLAVMDA